MFWQCIVVYNKKVSPKDLVMAGCPLSTVTAG